MASSTDKKVPEETVQYWLFLSNCGLDEEGILENVLSTAYQISSNYLWHDRCFNLTKKDFPVPQLFGSIHFGENADDEWFLVYILMEISRRFPQIVIRTRDFDGEFLLIEACDALPDWLCPETAENRVFIHSGQIHLIPYSEELKTRFSKHIGNAVLGVELIRKFPNQTLASPEINGAIARKLSEFPGCIEQNWHRAKCLIPANLAVILSKQPNFIAPAVRAFYLRDLSDLKACRELRHFGPVSSANLIMVSVKFTRHLYAMLVKQSFNPDRRSGWPIIGRNEPQFKANDLGLKLTCGFEILCSRCTKRRENGSKTDDQQQPEWVLFQESLKRTGYFLNEKEGSQKHAQLLKNAKKFYKSSTTNTTSNCGLEILSLLKSLTSEQIDATKLEAVESVITEDDDSWLNVTLAELESQSSFKMESISNEFSNGIEKLARPVANFLEKGSGQALKGAEPPKTSDDHSVDFQPDGFMNSMKSLMDLEKQKIERYASSDSESYGEEDLDIDLSDEMTKEMKEWGTKMASYMNNMDKELKGTTMEQSFVKIQPPKSKSPAADSIDLEEDDFTPVDVDKNLVSNMLDSYWSEAACSQSGPATTLIKGLSLNTPCHFADIDSDDEDE